APTAPAPHAIYPLSLHDALPICPHHFDGQVGSLRLGDGAEHVAFVGLEPSLGFFPLERPGTIGRKLNVAFEAPDLHELANPGLRSEEHTSELQSRENLVCRLLLE